MTIPYPFVFWNQSAPAPAVYWWDPAFGLYEDLAKTTPTTVDGHETRVWTDTIQGLDLKNDLTGTLVDGPNLATSGIGGLPSIDFQGANALATDAAAIATGLSGSDTPFTVLQVLRFDTLAAVRCSASLIGSTGTPAALHRILTSATPEWQSQRRGDNETSTTVSGGTPATGTDYILIERFNGTTVDRWINGTHLFSASALDKASATFSRFVIGNSIINGVGASAPMDGLMGDVKLWLEAVNDTTVTYEQEYFADKYGITL